MKKNIVYILHILFFAFALPATAATTINGKVVDAQTLGALAGATVSIPELKLTTSTGATGEFTFKNAPDKGKFLIEVKYLGYQTLTQTIDLVNIDQLVLKLSPSTIEAREVVITGSASSTDNRKNSTSVAIMSKEALVKQSTNIVDAISRIPGVSQITTGGGISKPVIRGLSYNRVVTLADGAKQEGQQWGDEHGIEVDQFGVSRVEVLKGAASLLYGSDALGGVVNLLEDLPVGDGQIKGELLTNYSTVNKLMANSYMVQGNNNGLTWRMRVSNKSAIAYQNPETRIPNTGFKELSWGGQIGLTKKWGYAHLNVSNFTSEIGLPDFSQNANGEFEDADGNVLSTQQIKSRNLLLPFQDVGHRKVAFNSNVLLGKGRVRTNISFQNNLRKEFEESSADPALFFDLKTWSYDFKYFGEERNGWEPVIGLSGAFQNSENRGEEFLIPNYQSNELGLFAYFKKNWTNTTFNLGSRVDYRKMTGEALEENGEIIFNSLKNSFSNLSGAVGLTHEFNERFSLKANAGSAFRAPNIAELGSNGVHEGTFRYEVGNADLKPERSFYSDFSLAFNTEKISTEWNVFYNAINNFIYYRQNGNETINAEGDIFPLFRFVQDKALLTGTEFSVTLHPIELIHWESSFAYTRGQNRTTNTPLPFIPAGVWRNELRLEPNIRGLKNNYIALGIDHFLKQNRTDSFETPTGSYTLVNASIGTSINWKKQEIRLHISASNLLDKAYFDHLSRFKPGRLDESNPNLGFFNPGRNISFGLFVPLRIK